MSEFHNTVAKEVSYVISYIACSMQLHLILACKMFYAVSMSGVFYATLDITAGGGGGAFAIISTVDALFHLT